jgi:hypothetical protein
VDVLWLAHIYRLSEVVRLFSSTGCRTIQWEKPRARDLHNQRRQQGVYEEGGTSAVYTSNYDRSAFDCCIASKKSFNFIILFKIGIVIKQHVSRVYAKCSFSKCV